MSCSAFTHTYTTLDQKTCDCGVYGPYSSLNIVGKKEATRVTRNIRYDIIDPEFLELMAKIADYGAKKYGNFDWQLSHLEGDKSPINHIYKHLKSFRMKEPYDHPELGEGIELHLAAIAFNAMMEFYWVLKEKKNV